MILLANLKKICNYCKKYAVIFEFYITPCGDKCTNKP